MRICTTLNAIAWTALVASVALNVSLLNGWLVKSTTIPAWEDPIDTLSSGRK